MSTTPAGFDEVFATLKQVFRRHLDRLSVQADSATEYTLVGRKALALSPAQRTPHVL